MSRRTRYISLGLAVVVLAAIAIAATGLLNSGPAPFLVKVSDASPIVFVEITNTTSSPLEYHCWQTKLKLLSYEQHTVSILEPHDMVQIPMMPSCNRILVITEVHQPTMMKWLARLLRPIGYDLNHVSECVFYPSRTNCFGWIAPTRIWKLSS